MTSQSGIFSPFNFRYPHKVLWTCQLLKLWTIVGVILICPAVTYSRTVIAMCWKQIGACPFQVKQAWHSHTVSIQMIQHNSGMWLAALYLMAGVQLFVYSWRVSLNQSQTTHPTICQLPLSFLIMMIATRARKRRLLIERRHFPYVCPPIKTNEPHVRCLSMGVPSGQAKQAVLAQRNLKICTSKKNTAMWKGSTQWAICPMKNLMLPFLHTSCKLLSPCCCSFCHFYRLVFASLRDAGDVRALRPSSFILVDRASRINLLSLPWDWQYTSVRGKLLLAQLPLLCLCISFSTYTCTDACEERCCNSK